MLAANAASALPIRIASARCSGQPGSATGHHRNRHRLAHRRRDFQVVSVLGAVAIHARQDDLARPQLLHLLRPAHRLQPRRQCGRRGCGPPTLPARARCTRFGSMFTTMHWLPNRRAASRTKSGFRQAAELIETLSLPALSKCANVLHRADASAHRQRHHDLLGRPPHHVDHDVPLLVAGRDVQKDQFVGPLHARTAQPPPPDPPHRAGSRSSCL